MASTSVSAPPPSGRTRRTSRRTRRSSKATPAKKPKPLHAHTGLPALADDTGLEVGALGGRPGVRSARFAGPHADDAANRARLLRELAGHADRAAQFRTVIALAEGGDVRYFEGVCRGLIIEEERGTGGFGYDALFVPEGEARTFAEMRQEEKNAISHRGRALREVAAYLRDRLAPGKEERMNGGKKEGMGEWEKG